MARVVVNFISTEANPQIISDAIAWDIGEQGELEVISRSKRHVFAPGQWLNYTVDKT